METLGSRIKKSGKGIEEQSNRFLNDTKEASKHFLSFFQDEAKDWSGYLRERYEHLETNGREALRLDLPKDKIWVHVDNLLAKISRREEAEEEVETEETTVEAAAEEILIEDAVEELEDSDEQEEETIEEETDEEAN